MQAAHDYLVKLLMLGDSGTGKSCLLLRFSDDSFTTSFHTGDIAFKIKTVEVDGKRVKLQIWDNAQQDRFRSHVDSDSSVFSGVKGILLVYDITEEQSFLNIRNHIRKIEKHASDSVKKILIGNKSDMADDRIITKERGQDLADEYGIEFFETSAKTNTNVKESFFAIATNIIGKMSMNDANAATFRALNIEKLNNPHIQSNYSNTTLQMVFPEFVLSDQHLELFDMQKAIYSFQDLKGERNLNWKIFVKTLLMFSFFPLTIIYQNVVFLGYTKFGFYRSLMPSQTDRYYIQTRIFTDFLSIVLNPDQNAFNLNDRNKSEDIEPTPAEIALRIILVLLSIVIYIFMWVAMIWYVSVGQNGTYLSSSECIGPFVIFIVLMVSISLWIAYEGKISTHSIDFNAILIYPLKFSSKYDNTDEGHEKYNSTNISHFLDTIKDQPLQRKIDKLISVSSVVFALVYGLLASFCRLIANKSFVPDHVTIWVFSILNNIILSYIVLRLCYVTTMAAFGDVLAYSQAITHILRPYKTMFINSIYYLPYLNTSDGMNLLSWLQLRGYVYTRIISRMANVEIWMTIFIFVQVVLSGVCLYRLVEQNHLELSRISEDIIFWSCAMFLVCGAIYVYAVVWIGSLLHKLHKIQIRALTAQSASFDYQLIKNNDMFSNINDEDEKEDKYTKSKAQIQHAIQRAIVYLHQHDTTPLIFGVRLDKVLWKSLIGVLLSLILSVIINYTR
eukprot:455118_1